jgi:hypothetical protein
VLQHAPGNFFVLRKTTYHHSLRDHYGSHSLLLTKTQLLICTRLHAWHLSCSGTNLLFSSWYEYFISFPPLQCWSWQLDLGQKGAQTICSPILLLFSFPLLFSLSTSLVVPSVLPPFCSSVRTLLCYLDFYSWGQMAKTFNHSPCNYSPIVSYFNFPFPFPCWFQATSWHSSVTSVIHVLQTSFNWWLFLFNTLFYFPCLYFSFHTSDISLINFNCIRTVALSEKNILSKYVCKVKEMKNNLDADW